jgi:FKBP12-rapamycin complex-associated protein
MERKTIFTGRAEFHRSSACLALFQSIKLQSGPEQGVKATLLALTLWFRYGGAHRRILTAVKAHLKDTPTNTWLPTIPQLIARLGAKDITLRYSLIDFLMQIAGSYADALIWPLLTASQTPRSVHQSAALDIMQQMSASALHTKMVKQSQMVGRELIMSAISPAERWKNAIEKVSSATYDPISLNRLSVYLSHKDALRRRTERVFLGGSLGGV